MKWIYSTLITTLVSSFTVGFSAIAQEFERLPQVPNIDVSQVQYVPTENTPDPKLEQALLKHLKYDIHPDYPITYSYNLVDLNGDNYPEALVVLSSPRFCGTGGCPTLIIQGTSNGYGRVLEQYLSYGRYVVTSQTHNGWKNIISFARCSDDFSKMCYHVKRYNGNINLSFSNQLNRSLWNNQKS